MIYDVRERIFLYF